MCGEHNDYPLHIDVVSGSSPHVRGAPNNIPASILKPGIIPACAGSTDLIDLNLAAHRDHPRMCGEHMCKVMCVTP